MNYSNPTTETKLSIFMEYLAPLNLKSTFILRLDLEVLDISRHMA